MKTIEAIMEILAATICKFNESERLRHDAEQRLSELGELSAVEYRRTWAD